MVEKKIVIPSTEYLTNCAIEKKEIPAEIRYPHTRESIEVNQVMNCKQTVEKEITESQSEAYNQIFEEDRQREKNREYRRNYHVKKQQNSK